jgi:hypothetical protein
MNMLQRQMHLAIALDVVALTGKTIDKAVGVIENPKLLRRILRLETEMGRGRPRRRMAAAIARRLAELKRLGLRTCRYCGCTERQGCPRGCGWATEDVCTQCVGAY